VSDDARTYRVRYECDPATRAWSALTHVDHGPASWGRTLEEARANIRDAIATHLELPDGLTLDDAGITVIDEVDES
jgi:predicted RNase H-like HicB family nuclease